MYNVQFIYNLAMYNVQFIYNLTKYDVQFIYNLARYCLFHFSSILLTRRMPSARASTSASVLQKEKEALTIPSTP